MTSARLKSLIFFPEAYYNYKERIEKLLGRPTIGFVDDVHQVGAQIAANPNPPQWGFGQPAAKKMDFGDIYIFYCQQVHASPVRSAETLRLSVEIRVACRSVDDNTAYRKIFSNLNNFLPADESYDVSHTEAIKRAEAIAAPGGTADVDRVGCAQLHLNSLFPTPAVEGKPKNSRSPPTCSILGRAQRAPF